MSWAPLFVATALDHLALMASRAYVPRPKRLNKQRQFLVGYHPWGTCAERRLKCTPILSVEKTICLLGASAWGAGFWFGTHPGAYLDAQLGQRQVGAIFALPLCLTPGCWYLWGKHLHTCWIPEFCEYHPGETSGSNGSDSQWDLCLQFSKTVYTGWANVGSQFFIWKNM